MMLRLINAKRTAPVLASRYACHVENEWVMLWLAQNLTFVLATANQSPQVLVRPCLRQMVGSAADFARMISIGLEGSA